MFYMSIESDSRVPEFVNLFESDRHELQNAGGGAMARPFSRTGSIAAENPRANQGVIIFDPSIPGSKSLLSRLCTFPHTLGNVRSLLAFRSASYS
jgi:hypothetical protein